MKTVPIVLIFLGLQLSGCEEEVERSMTSEETGLLVVEGTITNELTSHMIKLSHPHPEPDGNDVPATGAIVRIVEGNNQITYVVTEFPQGSGNYYTQVMRAVFGRTYTLSIQYQGKQFFASDSSVPVEPLQPLGYQKANNTSPALYRLETGSSGTTANFVTYDLRWDQTTYCSTGAACAGRLIAYDLKTIDVNEIAKPGKEDFLFPAGTIVIRKKYSLSAAYRLYLRSVLSETEWRGGLFDIERANTTTNLSSGAIGFFGVSTVVSDTTIVSEVP